MDYVKLELDAAGKTAVLTDDGDSKWKAVLTLGRPGAPVAQHPGHRERHRDLRQTASAGRVESSPNQPRLSFHQRTPVLG